MNLRIPAWAGPGTRISINGKAIGEKLSAGTFHRVVRTWKRGDVIEIAFDMGNRLEPLNAAHPEMVALMHGPLVLFPVEAPEIPLTRAGLLRTARVGPDLWQLEGGAARIRFKPFAAIGGENYRLYTRI